MGSLSRCLKKIGLGKHESAILRGAAREYIEDGEPARQAAIHAVMDHIDDLLAERADIVSQVEAKGGAAPAAPLTLEIAREIVGSSGGGEATARVAQTERARATVENQQADQQTGGVVRNSQIANEGAEISPDSTADSAFKLNLAGVEAALRRKMKDEADETHAGSMGVIKNGRLFGGMEESEAWWKSLTPNGRRMALDAVGVTAIKKEVLWGYLPAKVQKDLATIIGTTKDPIVSEQVGAGETEKNAGAQTASEVSPLDAAVAAGADIGVTPPQDGADRAKSGNDRAKSEDSAPKPSGAAHPETEGEREKDSKGHPIYRVGDRVEYVAGQYQGRHGAISSVSPMKTVLLGLSHAAGYFPQNEEINYYYNVKTDNGADFLASPEEIRFETMKPGVVVPDIVLGGMTMEPRRVFDGIGYARRSADSARAAAQRARKPSMIAEHKRTAERNDKKAADYGAAWDAWAEKYPEEAAKIVPAPKAQPAAPVAVGDPAAALKVAGLTVVKTTTNKGTQAWNVSGNTKVHSEIIKAAGGRWYGPKKVWSFYNGDPTAAIAARLGGAAPAPAESATILGKPTIEMPDATLERIAEQETGAGEKARSELDARDKADKTDLGAMFDDVLAEEMDKGLHDELDAEMRAYERKTERTAGQAIKSAAGNTGKGLLDAIDGLGRLFGSNGSRLSSGLSFDEKTYEQAKPLFASAISHFKAAGQDIKEAMRAVVRMVLDKFGPQAAENMKPYVVRFMEDVRDGKVNYTANKEDARDDAAPVETGKDGDRVPESGATADLRPTDGEQGSRSGGEAAGRDGAAAVQRDGSELDGAGLAGEDQGAKRGRTGESAVRDDAGAPAGRSRPGANARLPGGRNYLAPTGSLERTGSWLETARRNVDIIALVKRLEAEGRWATPEEQALIAQYTGFGASEIANGLFPVKRKTVKSGRSYVSTTTGEIDEYALRPGWKETYERLRDLLTPEELTTATRSTQYAHYTSEPIIRAIWRAAARMGFHGGKILEPGMGTGLFMVAAPEDVATGSKYVGIEMDRLTAAIARQLLQKQNIINASYTRQALPDNTFDAAFGNPPFSSVEILEDPRYRKQKFKLHDFFFAKTIDKVRPGGLVVFVTSKGTMDKLDDKARAYLAERADLLGAIRLPQTAFKGNAGTEVVTDVLFLQKRLPGQAPGGQAWMGQGEVQTGEGPALINEYFAAHPEMVLGTHSLTGSMYRNNEYTVLPPDGNIAEHFDRAAGKLPENVYLAEVRKSSGERQQQADRQDFDVKHHKEGGLYVAEDGALMQVVNGVGVPLDMKLSPTDAAWLRDYVPLRDDLKTAIRTQLEDGDWQAAQKALVKRYRAFVKKHGRILEHTRVERTTTDDDGEKQTVVYRRYKREKLFSSKVDTEASLILQLEVENDENTDIADGAILSQRVLAKREPPKIETPDDALAVSLNEIGHFDLEHVAGLLKLGEREAIASLGNLIYEDPAEGWQTADEYLSGNVLRKLEEAQAAALLDDRYRRNVEALTAVQPEPLGPDKIMVRLGANWVPTDVVSLFAREVLDKDIDVSYDVRSNIWTVPESKLRMTRRAGEEFGTKDRSPLELLSAILNNQAVTVREEILVGESKKTVVNKEATLAANEAAKKMRERFASWVWTDAMRTERLLDIYNRKYNNIAPRSFDGSHLTLPGLSLRFKLYPHQLRAIWRTIQTGNAYLAHAVGAGKTLEMIVAAMEQRRLGLVRKPMFVVPNHMLEQFANEFQMAYPAARILVADEENFVGDQRRRFVAKAALNDWDAVIIKQSSFKIIGIKEQTARAVADDILEELHAALDDVEKSDRVTRKRLENQIEAVEQRVSKLSVGNKDNNLAFEEIGVDYLIVDEAHGYRKLDFSTNRPVKGVDPNGSLAAFDMFAKVRYLESRRPGRSLVMASGTPITNTMAELYTIQRFLDYEQLREDGLHAFDAWANMYGEVNAEWERNAAGQYEKVERFSRFINVPELMRSVRTFMDVLTMDQLGELVQRPDLIGGKPEMMTAPKTDALEAYMRAVLLPRLEASRKWKPSREEPHNPDPVIAIGTDGRLAALDMRFVQPLSASDPQSKLNLMIDEIARIYKETAGNAYTTDGKPDKFRGGAQIVFSAVGFGEMVAKNRGFDARKWLTNRLRDMGVPASDIAFMDDHKTDAKKEAMFKEMREGKKRVLIGSPKNMGTGLNVQKRLTHLHFLAPPWYPADVEQPHGRILRQGNQNAAVSIKWYVTEGTYDSTMWGMVRRKGQAIAQAFSGGTARTVEDISEVSQYAMAEAVASGDDRVIQLAELQARVAKLESLKLAHFAEQREMRGNLESAKSLLASYRKSKARAEVGIAELGKLSFYDPLDVTVDGKVYSKPGEYGAALIAAAKSAFPDGGVLARINGKWDVAAEPADARGNFRYLDVNIRIADTDYLVASLREDEMAKDGGADAVGLGQKLRNTLQEPRKNLEHAESGIERANKDIQRLTPKIGAPFEHAGELAQAIADAATLQAELTAPAQQAAPAPADDNTETAPESRAPSAGSLTREEIAFAVSPILAQWKNAPRLAIFQNVAEARDAFPKLDIHDDANGFYYGGAVVLIADNIGSRDMAEYVLLHESIGHAGLRSLLRDKLEAVMRDIFQTNVKMQLWANKWLSTDIKLENQERIKNGQPILTAEEERKWRRDKLLLAVEEVLAQEAGTGRVRELKGWQKFVAAFKAVLRSLGFTLKWTDDDIVALLRRSAEHIAGKGRAHFMTMNDDERAGFSKGSAAGQPLFADMRDRVAFAHQFLQELAASEPDVFRYPTSAAGTLQGVFLDVFPGATYEIDATAADEKTESGADRKYGFVTPETKTADGGTRKGKQFFVYTTRDRVWVDLQHLEPGDQGSRIYAAVANFAFNTRRVFGGDPKGVSADAIVARTKMMLSSALRMGTTRHLDASREQIKGIPDARIPPLDWRGDDVAKTRALIHNYLTFVHNQAPDIKGYRYDFANRQFLDRSGKGFHPSRAAFDDALRGGQRAAARIGADSGRAAILIQSLVSQEGRTLGDEGILQAVLDQSRQIVEGGLDGVFSRNGLPETDAGETPFDRARLPALRRSAAGLERPQDGIFLRITEDGQAIATGPKGARVPARFIRFAADHGLKFMARRRLPSPGNKKPGNVNRIEARYSSPLPIDYRESGALYFNEMGDAWLDRTEMARFSRASDAAINLFDNIVTSHKTFGWWSRTIGTQYHKAQQDADFGRVFRLGQDFLDDASRIALRPADLAPGILPKFENLRHAAAGLFAGKKASGDVDAIGKAVFGGTLENKAYTVQELRAMGLTDVQIGLYHQFRDATRASLSEMANSEAWKLAQPHVKDSLKQRVIEDPAGARQMIVEALDETINTTQDDDALEVLDGVKDSVTKLYERLDSLIANGYAPLMRFGRYTVDVFETDPTTGRIAQDDDGNEIRHYFSMFETEREANAMAKAMRDVYPGATVQQGVMSQKAFEIFNGVSPESMELFAEAVGAEQSAIFQQYLKLAKSNRSAMKRLIHRKGVAGYSPDVTRVLAQFITSNARLASGNFHRGDMMGAVQAIPREKGDVVDEAVTLYQYLNNPREEVPWLRGYMFMHYLGGSIASALVNLTQPVMMTAPYLTTLVSAPKAAGLMAKATKLALSKQIADGKLAEALHRAEQEGIVAPQEIHHLQAEAMRNMGGHYRLRAFMHLWGAPFAMAESFNRRHAFIAAWLAAKETGKSPYATAVKAVHETQGLYNRGNRPNWARGAIGATVMTFKQYSIAYVELFKRLPAKQRAIMLGVLLLVSGLQGLPFAEDLEDLIDSLLQAFGYPANSKKALRDSVLDLLGDGFGDYVVHGVSALPVMPLDVHGRLGMQNLIPGTKLFKRSETDKTRDVTDILGPVGGLARGAMDATSAAMRGDAGAITQAILPRAIANLAKAYQMADTGEYRDTRGRKVADIDAIDVAAKAIGFQPAEVAHETRLAQGVRDDVAFYRTMESEFAERIARGIINKDPDAVREARLDLAAWNRDNPEAPIRIKDTQILRRVREAMLSRNQRLTKSSPQELRGAIARELGEGG